MNIQTQISNQTQSKSPNPQNITISQELIIKAADCAYFLNEAIRNIKFSYIPTIQALLEQGDIHLAGNQIKALSDYLNALEQYNGTQASIDVLQAVEGEQ